MQISTISAGQGVTLEPEDTAALRYLVLGDVVVVGQLLSDGGDGSDQQTADKRHDGQNSPETERSSPSHSGTGENKTDQERLRDEDHGDDDCLRVSDNPGVRTRGLAG